MTISAQQREALGEAVGEAGLEEHAPLELDRLGIDRRTVKSKIDAELLERLGEA